MDYTLLNNEHKQTMLANRLAELEQEHYTTELYREEAELIGNQQQVTEFSAKLAGLEIRINEYRKKLQENEPEATKADNE
jgi:hypothetical protein